ncbi:uncharacterized protein L3040_006032 [Drepanopeziza brunnea f. sp. 'multigermtubi']|uniref:uncharacterized protein n=1 Tax=Drepanopeziza brunnea f. sp. 'multigermtubi' TaxID=698441 RepID=UPI0023A0FAA1|nr:hypothetical protein L3040_006032 [Drepanopeziza brunnea f. sp. 'multigermtubi']
MVTQTALSQLGWVQLSPRETRHPSASLRVSEDIQARTIDRDTALSFDFGQRQDQLPARPSISGGLASSFAKWPDAEDLQTRDDVDFNNPFSPHGFQATLYNFPLPGSLSPALSPRSVRSPSAQTFRSIRPSTPESVDRTLTIMSVPHGEIGMALGSPPHPLPTAWQHVPPMDRYTDSPDHNDEDFIQPAPTSKQKKSTWKKLGGFFGGKKHDAQPTAFYQVQPVTITTSSHGLNFSEPPLTSEKPPKSRILGRSVSNARRTKHKPHMSRTNTLPVLFDLESEGRGAHTGTSDITLNESLAASHIPKSSQKGAGLLDIDIPSVSMERYSIMFGDVLQLQHHQTQQSSLLTRRAATLDKLKPVDEKLASEEREPEANSNLLKPRRATSPGPQRSPGFSLFPSPTPRTRDPSPPQSRTLQRSHTSPTALSPSRASFAADISNDGHASIVSEAIHVPKFSESGTTYAPRKSSLKKEGPKAVTKSSSSMSKSRSPENPIHALDPASEEADDVKKHQFPPIAVAIPMQPKKLPEPQWPITESFHTASNSISSSSITGSDVSTASSITTPLSASTAPYPVVKPLRGNTPPMSRMRPPSASQKQKPALTRTRSVTTENAPIAIPRRQSSPLLVPRSTFQAPVSSPKSGDESRLEDAADISIARQISVSRRQRQLLVPIKTGVKAHTRTSSKNANRVREGEKKERVVGAQNFPSPARRRSSINLRTVSSPLTAIAIATKEEHERVSPVPEKRVTRDASPSTKRLMLPTAKPSTPTLVVVGDRFDEREKAWAGATAGMKQRQKASSGVSERSKAKEAASTQSMSFGEIKVGLAVSRDASPARKAKDLSSHRKSVSAVFERVSA